LSADRSSSLRLAASHLLLASVVLLTTVALWQTHRPPRSSALFDRRPQGVMGTSCLLVVLAPVSEAPRAQAALDAAEAELRAVETRLSTYIEASEISRLNRAGAGELVPLSGISLEVLRAARDAANDTEGAFDSTCRPLLLLWKEAGRRQRLPSVDELEAARASVGWRYFELQASGARKTLAQAQQDLGGLGKGYAVDRAAEAMRASGVESGLVQVGGDTRVFGPGPGGGDWEIQVRHPFREGTCGTIRLRDAAICTSGNYQRYVEIEGRRHSHIVDPRTGQPMDRMPSVSVIAPRCMTADIWATAFSVLGPDGLEERCRRAGIHAMLVTGEPGGAAIHPSSGFGRFVSGAVDVE
jgi:thiamine biosynthesis lipoprotein